MVTVAITGVGGLVGRRLVAELDADPSVERILGIDVADLGAWSPRSSKLELVTADVRDVRLDEHLAGVDVVCHLAFRLDPMQDEWRMRNVNVEGTRNVFTCALRAGVSKLVYASSGVVYGAHPDNDIPLTEDSPLRANPDFNYAEHKLEVEQWVWPWVDAHPETTVTVLRPSIVAGPGVQNVISRAFEAPRLLAVRGHKPPWQFVHVDDLAAALAHAVREDLPGAYNCTSEGWLSFDEITAIAGRKVLEIGEEVAFETTDRLWRLGIGDYPAGAVHYVMHPWVLSADRLIETGWRPKHSNRDALAELVADHRDHVTVGPVRTRRSTLRSAATALAGLVGLAVLVRAVRRRRSA